jgi:hypothetical protein
MEKEKEMSDTFDHAGEAVDRLLNGEGEEEGWVCTRCGSLNSFLVCECQTCGASQRSSRQDMEEDIFGPDQ